MWRSNHKKKEVMVRKFSRDVMSTIYAGFVGIQVPLKKANPGKSGDAKPKGPESGQPGYQRKNSED